jgi:hypothetical protein
VQELVQYRCRNWSNTGGGTGPIPVQELVRYLIGEAHPVLIGETHPALMRTLFIAHCSFRLEDIVRVVAHAAVLDGFEDVFRADGVFAFQVRDGTGYPQNAVVGAA